MNRYHEIQSGKDRGKSRDEDCQPGFNDFCIRVGGAEGYVEGPTCIDASGQHAVKHHHAADNVQVPTQQVDAGECQVLGPDHHWNQKVAQHGRNGWNQEEEDHHHAVQGEEFVVGIGLYQVPGGSQQLQPDEQREESSDKKEKRNREQVEKRNAFVVRGEQPRCNAVLLVQISLALTGVNIESSHTHST